MNKKKFAKGGCLNKSAYKAIHNSKSLGVDGLPKEFYFLTWDFLGDSFVIMASNCFEMGTLSESQKFGVLLLICKNPEKSEQLNC